MAVGPHALVVCAGAADVSATGRRKHLAQHQHDKMHLPFEYSDQAPAVTELRVRAVKAKEVGEGELAGQ